MHWCRTIPSNTSDAPKKQFQNFPCHHLNIRISINQNQNFYDHNSYLYDPNQQESTRYDCCYWSYYHCTIWKRNNVVKDWGDKKIKNSEKGTLFWFLSNFGFSYIVKLTKYRSLYHIYFDVIVPFIFGRKVLWSGAVLQNRTLSFWMCQVSQAYD